LEIPNETDKSAKCSVSDRISYTPEEVTVTLVVILIVLNI